MAAGPCVPAAGAVVIAHHVKLRCPSVPRPRSAAGMNLVRLARWSPRPGRCDTRFPWTGRPLDRAGRGRSLGRDLADPAHSLGGRIGMVAELLRHPASAATDAEPPHGPVDGLCHPSGGQRLRRLQSGDEQSCSVHAAHVDPVIVLAGQHNGSPPGNGQRSYAARGLAMTVTVVAHRYIVDLH